MKLFGLFNTIYVHVTLSAFVNMCVCVWAVCVDPGQWPFVFEEGSPASHG